MISEGSCDTDWTNDAENSALPSQEKILKYIKIKKKTVTFNYITFFYCIFDQINGEHKRDFFLKLLKTSEYVAKMLSAIQGYFWMFTNLERFLFGSRMVWLWIPAGVNQANYLNPDSFA